MAANRTFSLSEASALFKIKYGKLSENVYNSANVLLGRVKKSYNFTGKQILHSIPQSFAGGVGSGSLPTANTAQYSEAIITAKKMYAVVEIDRESIKAAMSDEGAFVRATKEVVQKGVESWMRNMSRALFNDGSGKLAEGDDAGANVSGAGSLASPYVIKLADSTKDANIEERDLVNVDTETTALEILSYDPSTQLVELVGSSATLAGLSGSGPFAAANELYMQNSKDNDPEGLKGVLDATSGTKYGIAVARRWKAEQIDASAASISSALMNKAMLAVEKKTGKVPNLIITSYKQFEKLLNIFEDDKRYPIPNRAGVKDKNGVVISFSGIQFMSTSGPVPVVAERFCEDDRMYFLNDNYIEIYHRPDFGWFDDDGTVFLRKASSDEYEARYGGYLQVYIDPNFHAVITNLSTT
jgi:hypothetical protein